jgi:hypothetical protein
MQDEIAELIEEVQYWHSAFIREVEHRTMGGTPMRYDDRWENRALGTPEKGAPRA